MAKNYSKQLAEAIRTFLVDDDWNFDFDADDGIFTFGINLKGRMRSARYAISVHSDDYTVYCLAPLHANHEDADMMNELAKFVCMANYNLRNGNFELDLNDGEIRYKVFVDCEDLEAPTREMIKNSIIIPALMLDRYSEGILKILFGNCTAKDAIALCEG